MRYRFRRVEIDEEAFAVRRDGADVRVEPRVLELLLYLLRHRQRMVSKAELFERVWRGDAVGDSVIARCVCIVRQLFGDTSVIRTVHGRGYQWTAILDDGPASRRVEDHDTL